MQHPRKRLKLMMPGPVEVDPAVLAAMAEPVRPHYGAEWTEFYNQTAGMLRVVFGTAQLPLLIVGSGAAGIEACLGSALLRGEKVIVGVNGFFGEMLVEQAEFLGLEVVQVDGPWDRPLDPQRIAAALDAHPDAILVAVVHHETSTTLLNPVAEIGAETRSRGTALLVDAISSIGGVPFEMDAWGVDFACTATQKCLGNPPGLAPIAVSERGWELVSRHPHKDHGWYLNLHLWRDYIANWGDWHPYPITMATNNVVALRKSLDILFEEGLASRFRRFEQTASYFRSRAERDGLELYTRSEWMAPVATAFRSPPGIASGRIVTHMSENYRLKIAGALSQLEGQIYRIGHMSPITTEGDLDEVIEALMAFQP